MAAAHATACGLPSLRRFLDDHVAPRLVDRPNALRNHQCAVRRLEEFLDRPALVEDLTEQTLGGLLTWMGQRNRAEGYVNTIRRDLIGLSKAAAECGLIADVARPAMWTRRRLVLAGPVGIISPGRLPGPWSPPELQQIVVTARKSPGEIAGLPARRWWPAVILCTLDTARPIKDLLSLPTYAYDGTSGTVRIGDELHRLSGLTIEAVEALLNYDPPQLFPWRLDRSLLYREYKRLLWRARLPHVRGNLFERLRWTGHLIPCVVDSLDLDIDFAPREGKPYLSRARDRRKWEAARRRRQEREAAVVRSRPKREEPETTIITIKSDRTLRAFFETYYLPRLTSEGTRHDYTLAVRLLEVYCACTLTLDALSDDLIERFLYWRLASGKQPETVNGDRGALLAIWRLAWKKRLVDDLPRDVPKMKGKKRLPTAWSPDEVGRILSACAQVSGEIAGVRASLWWTSLISALYDSGLRINALLSARSADLNIETGWLNVMAEHQKHRAEQNVRLHPDTIALIAETEPHCREMLFPWPHRFVTLLRRYNKILKAAGLPHTSRDKFQRLRRTTGTFIADAAGDEEACRQLGHSGVGITKKHYIDPRYIRGRVIPSDVLPRPEWSRSAG